MDRYPYPDDDVVIINGRTHTMETASWYMDDMIRERLHYTMAPCSGQEFVNEYIREHEAQYNEQWDVV